ncbi:MAG TPA: S1/P1 nuclease [Gemmatirosa sp.]
MTTTARPAESRAIALAWILHLVGDVHQPLHTASRVTADAPQGDRGGNAVQLIDDGRPTNLHAVWDDVFDEGPGRRAGGAGRGTPGPEARLAAAERVADALEGGTRPEAVGSKVGEARPAVWAQEGQAIDETSVYTPDLVAGGPLPDTYVARARDVAAPRAALAGYRLATLLNQAFGGTSPAS